MSDSFSTNKTNISISKPPKPKGYSAYGQRKRDQIDTEMTEKEKLVISEQLERNRKHQQLMKENRERSK